SFLILLIIYFMSLEVTGKLHEVFPIQQIKETFSKREFVLEITDESPSGMVYTNYAAFQLVNNNCSLIDAFQPGEQLKVSFNIRGNRWERDGQVRYITNLNAWRIERVMEGATPTGTPNYQPNPGTPSGGTQGMPQGDAGDDGGDLPF